jgi:leucyl aminopeptidase
MIPTFADPAPDAVPITCIEAAALEAWCAGQPEGTRAWVAVNGFEARAGQMLRLPAEDMTLGRVLFGLGGPKDRARGRLALGAAAAALPAGTYALDPATPAALAEEGALAWLLAARRFAPYKAAPGAAPGLVAPSGVDAARIEAMAAGEWLTRDLIDTPAAEMGPAELAGAAQDLARAHGARCEVIEGAALAEGFPLIEAVGRASARAPRLIDLRWGEAGPRLTLVGKGVCFDTGGLNLKPGGSMALMKKDMGGAATVLGLARTIMTLGLPLRLRVLIPAVENAVAGDAMRPGDVLRARNGLTVEVNNTDAEGRLVLADALDLADEEAPDLLICMATLTGAARVALGPDIAPFYTDDDALAGALARGAGRLHDPLWRMPLHRPYEPMIEPEIADLDNAPAGGMAGSITAALFLDRFVARAARFAHFDIYGWTPKPAPARPRGGVGQGARAILAALPEVLDL